jgi:hypothetical protein
MGNLAMYKHYSLVRTFVNYRRKKFYKIGPRSVILHSILTRQFFLTRETLWVSDVGSKSTIIDYLELCQSFLEARMTCGLHYKKYYDSK